MNQFISDFRAETESKTFKAELRKRERVSRKNHLAAKNHVDYLFERHARLLVVRVDVGYGNSVKEKVTYAGANAHKGQLIAHVQKNYPDLVGFMWKLEYTPQKRYHYHPYAPT